ncbi:MAG: hypothetical protein R2705_14870 [Ilumatobacteraceae bacterium]
MSDGGVWGRIDELVDRTASEDRVPRLALAVVRDGSIVHRCMIGDDPFPPPTEATVFRDRLGDQELHRGDGPLAPGRPKSPRSTIASTSLAPELAAIRPPEADCSADHRPIAPVHGCWARHRRPLGRPPPRRRTPDELDAPDCAAGATLHSRPAW